MDSSTVAIIGVILFAVYVFYAVGKKNGQKETSQAAQIDKQETLRKIHHDQMENQHPDFSEEIIDMSWALLQKNASEEEYSTILGAYRKKELMAFSYAETEALDYAHEHNVEVKDNDDDVIKLLTGWFFRLICQLVYVNETDRHDRLTLSEMSSLAKNESMTSYFNDLLNAGSTRQNVNAIIDSKVIEIMTKKKKGLEPEQLDLEIDLFSGLEKIRESPT